MFLNLLKELTMRTTLLTLALCTCLLIPATGAAATRELKVLGQPMSVGLIQKKEQAFFENFAKRTGLDVKVIYTPIDVTGFKSVETMRLMKNGLFDIISIRMGEASQDEPFFMGLDLVGLNPDYKTARQTYELAREPLIKRMKERFNTELLGLWCFGPQVLFCKPEITGVKDLKGKKVSASNKGRSVFLESVGAVPVALDFPDVQQALSKGVIDCAITGASSANTAGWTEVTDYFMGIGFQMAFNAYGINTKTMSKFTPEEQTIIRRTFADFADEVWGYSEELYDDALRCITGQDPCTTGPKRNLKNVPVEQDDVALFNEGVRAVSYPVWAELCDKSFKGCSDLWKQLFGERTGVK